MQLLASRRENRGYRDVGGLRAFMHVELRDQIEAGSAETALPACRFCGTPMRHTFVDLGMSPLCESYVPPERLEAMEPFYPLHVRVCERLPARAARGVRARRRTSSPSTRTSRPTRTRGSPTHATTSTSTIERFGLGAESLVVELASNDGYLLQHFVERGVPAARHRARGQRGRGAAQERGDRRPSSTSSAASSRAGLAAAGSRADLLVANNVLAHVPDLNDFVGGMREVLLPRGASSPSSSRTWSG